MRLWWRKLRYKWAWIRFFFADDFAKVAGSPMLGKSREERNRNLRLMAQRRDAKAPKPEDYGLPK